ncbi:MAG: stage V sporulation protein AD [Clostridia bacterium]|nr:stage V sporulation protein AD [Clostridia bacterium]
MMKNAYKTLIFENSPSIIETYSIVGKKEGEGSLGKYFNLVLSDDRFGETTYEKAECKMLSTAVKRVINSANLKETDVDLFVAGDLLNQIISASFTARDFEIPYLGLYNACATIVESIIVSSMAISGKFISNAVVGAVSHFSTAERQYRYPLELGSVRPPQAQWTVTGAGAYVLSEKIEGFPSITSATVGKVVDFGVTDVNNMGAAMAPSCASTLVRHLKGTNTFPDEYDVILTGDLGLLGSKIFRKLCRDEGFEVELYHVDAGSIIYDSDGTQDQGGSGAGCGTVTFASYLYPLLRQKKIKKALFLATGALLSTISSGQGESIPGITHCICVENL